MTKTDCVFCKITSGDEPAQIVRRGIHSLTIVPLNPVTKGHVIVIPHTHVNDATQDPHVTANTMGDAAVYAQANNVGPCNFITSVGREATQSVFHLHIHVVPRKDNDGLALPWYSGKTRKSSTANVTH